MKESTRDLITTILPVITLLIGLCAGPVITWFAFKIKNHMKYKYIIQLIQLVIGQIEKQQKNISNCIENLNDLNKTDYLIRPISGNYLVRLNRINDDDFYNAFVHRRILNTSSDLTLFTRVVQRIDYFSDCIPHILSANQKTISEINELIDKWHSIYKKTVETFNNEKTEYLKTHDYIINDPLLFPIDEILLDSKKIFLHLNNPQIALNKVVTPISDICKNQPADKRANTIFHLMQEATYILNAYLYIKKSHSEYLTKGLNELKLAAKEFKEDVDNFSQHK
jgi:hypothetical protein